MLGTPELVEIPTVYPNTKSNITRVVEQILSIEWGFVVELLEKGTSITSADNQFYASFPILISEKKYTIVISGNTDLLKKQGIGGRKHPFIEDGMYTPGKLTRWDFELKGMDFSFLDTDSLEILHTNDLFWKQLRNRIPVIHPLSLILQN